MRLSPPGWETTFKYLYPKEIQLKSESFDPSLWLNEDYPTVIRRLVNNDPNALVGKLVLKYSMTYDQNLHSKAHHILVEKEKDR
jgi:hypothetical protein